VTSTVPIVQKMSGSTGADRTDRGIAVTVIVPVTERPERLDEIYLEYSEPFRNTGDGFEFLFVMGPEHAGTSDALLELAERGEPVSVFETGQRFTEATLLKAAVERCQGDVVVTLPAYHRIGAEGLVALVEEVTRGSDLATARRWPRTDPLLNRLQARLFHALVRLSGVTDTAFSDLGSGVRAMRPEVLVEMPLYGDFARFLPLFAARDGYRVSEVSVPHHPRDAGRRVYRPGVYVRRLLDIFGVFFLLRFTEKPLRFFGLIGGVLSLAGGGMLLVLFVQRLQGQALADRPLLLLAMLVFLFGVQAIALGLVGEMIVHLSAARAAHSYRLARK
jgi:hypothetical protein